MKRRDFLSMTTLAAGAVALTPLAGVAQTTTPMVPVEPFWVPLTKEVKTTRIGFGTGMRGGNRRSDLVRGGYPKAIEMLRYAYDMGIRLFDCADMYGTHDVVAEALRGKPRDSYVLVTKVWVRPGGIPETERLAPEELIKRFLREFGALRTDYIDVVQIHCMDNNRWTGEWVAAMESLEKAKKAGLIRAHGISSHSNAATEKAAETEWCDVVHVRINSEGMHMDGPRDDAAARVAETVRTTKVAHEAGKGVIAMKVVGQGDMKDLETRKKSTKFVMDLGTVNCMIVGFTEKEQITEFVTNVAALSKYDS
jgi:aryl-alcohol dehydrogenase-like predicted oxidoreductase